VLFKVENCSPDQYANDVDKQLALDNLLVSSGRRKNIVLIDKEAIQELINSNLYRPPVKTFALDIEKSRREYGVIAKKLAVYCIVDFNSRQISCTFTNNQSVIKIGYDYFIDPENTGNIGLITEGELDFNFYSKIATYYSNYISSFKLGVSFKFHLGGGSQSKPRFDTLTDEGKIILCLVDNDKSHPEKGEGDTSRVFTQKDRKYNNKSLANVIHVREIETLLPLKVIEEILVEQKNVAKIDALDEVKAFNLVNPNFRTFFDHKVGFTLKNAIELDAQYGDFWLNILESNNRFSQMNCLKDKVCYNCGNCPEIAGFGDNILRNVNEQLGKSHLRKLIIPPDILPHWRDIGELMMGWGCVPNARISRAS
jgi:hypothetical protein